MQSLPKARPVQDLSAIDGTRTFIMTAVVMIVLAFAFNAHAQETVAPITLERVSIDRVEMMMMLPIQERCTMISNIGLQGGEIRRVIELSTEEPLNDGIDAMMAFDDQKGFETQPGYTRMTESELAYRRVHTERGWNLVDEWIADHPEYMATSNNNIPSTMLDQLRTYIFGLCMTDNIQ